MKNIFKILSIAAILGMVSCKKVLEVQPQQSIDAATALENDQDVKSAVVGCYSLLGGGALYGTNLLMLPDLQGSESYCSWRGTFQGFRQVAGKTMTRDNTEAARTWIAAYRAINNANIVLANLSKVSDVDLRTQLEGEALFIRGILHFELVRMYGLPYDPLTANTQPGVVIKTTPSTNETTASERIARSTVAEVYTRVVSDLTTAVTKLPNDNGTRADKFTAYAFLSRVYLQMGNYADARDAANEVINSLKYELAPIPLIPFTNKNTKESIWEIQQNEQNNAGQSNDGMATFFASTVGIGRADVRMNTGFISTFYDAADFRRRDWYYIGTGARPGNTYCNKWNAFEQNLPVIRIAEMFLTRAECNRRLNTTVGNTPQTDLTFVRNRSNVSAIIAPTVSDILNERTRELAFEGLRIHDIKRTKGATGSFAWNDNRLVFPIPQREVDASGGIITQNPGY
ncbi:MAG: hypothetical protein RIR12_913 [Bacteroidota bacterium]|jgi:hypothetical protein